MSETVVGIFKFNHLSYEIKMKLNKKIKMHINTHTLSMTRKPKVDRTHIQGGKNVTKYIKST